MRKNLIFQLLLMQIYTKKINEYHIRVGHHGRDRTWVEVGVQRLMT